MFRQSETPIMAPALLDALLASLSARPAAALFNAAKVLLFSNDFLVTPESVLADFTESVFAGYAAGGVALPALAGPGQVANGTRVMIANVTFVASGGLVPPGVVVFGYMIVGNAGVDLYAYEKFAEPVAIAVPGDFIDLALLIPEPAFRPAA